MSVLTFEGLSKTFKASTNVYSTYFVIKLYIIMITHVLKLLAKCLLLIIKLLGTHVIGQGLLKLPKCSEILTFKYVCCKYVTFEGLFESSTLFMHYLTVLVSHSSNALYSIV